MNTVSRKPVTTKNKPKKANIWPVAWHAIVIDAGDGSGDGLIELPKELLKCLGWKIGDTLDLSVRGISKIIVKKVE